MVVLGLGFTHHDASAALVIDGELRTAIARERLTRLKRDGMVFGSRRLDLGVAIRYCLDVHGLTLADVDLLAWNHIDHLSKAQVAAILMLEGGLDLSRIPWLALPHHFAHACASFYLSPFPEAAVLVADGRGGPLEGLKCRCEGPESQSVRNGAVVLQNFLDGQSQTARELESFYYCDGRQWTTFRKTLGLYGGIGARYGSVSSRLFENPLDAGKTMGLAPYGRHDERPLFLEVSDSDSLPAFKAIRGREWTDLKSQIIAWRSAYPGEYQAPLPVRMAATVQHEAEEAMLTYARWLRRTTKSANLCLSGGVALNCVANSYVAEEAGFERVFVPPAPGDDGIAIGCALYGAALHGELRRGSCPVFVGRGYSHNPDDLRLLGLETQSAGSDLAGWVAERIAGGAVVAWYQAGAEFGPRALGHRSFLADPRHPAMRHHLNKVVKNRELFRPFAPVVMEEFVSEFFDRHHPSYYMSFVARVLAEKRSVVPAITHVDGTARYQVLRKSDNPELYAVIAAFAKRTGVPMLLNTSFNRAGEPIVETPLEAGRCMLAACADFLVLDGMVYGRPAQATSNGVSADPG
jgi:carbamoyltransferase